MRKTRGLGLLLAWLVAASAGCAVPESNTTASASGPLDSGEDAFCSPGLRTVQPVRSPISRADMQAGSQQIVTVPAGHSIDVPLSFEGASVAVVFVAANAAGICARFGSAELTGTPGYETGWIDTAPLWDPVDGPLHITNSGSADQIVGVGVLVKSARALTVNVSNKQPAAGETVTLDMVLSEAVPADAVEAEVVDLDGKHSPLPVALLGTGHWTATFTPRAGGPYTINVWTTGAAPRRSRADLVVTGHDIAIAGTFTESLEDRNDDGHKDLVITLPVTVTKVGSYVAQAQIETTGGTGVAVSLPQPQVYDFASGSRTVDIVFSGLEIERSGLSGPYRIVDVRTELMEADGIHTVDEDTLAALGTTKNYPLDTFKTHD